MQYANEKVIFITIMKNLLMSLGLSTQLLVVLSKSLRLLHFHKVHSKNNWYNNHGEGCQLLSSFQKWCLFLHGLLVMLVICLINFYMKFILFIVACLMLLQHSQSSTTLRCEHELIVTSLCTLQLHFTYEQLLHYNTLLPRVHSIEAKVTHKDHGNCKLSCFNPPSMFVYNLVPIHVFCYTYNPPIVPIAV